VLLPWPFPASSQSQLNTFAISPFLTQPLMRVVKATMSGVAPAPEGFWWRWVVQNHQTSLLEMGNELDLYIDLLQ
jgi:hypothetical protein